MRAEAQQKIADRIVAYHPNLEAGWEMRALVYGSTGNRSLWDADTTMRFKQLTGRAKEETVKSYHRAAHLSPRGSLRRTRLELQGRLCHHGYIAGTASPDKIGSPAPSWLGSDGLRAAYTRNDKAVTMLTTSPKKISSKDLPIRRF